MNTFGLCLRVTTFGESHGRAVGCVLDGLPAGLFIDRERIALECARRRGGRNEFATQRKEPDQVEILSGVFEGKTTGAPLALMVLNEDVKSRDYEDIKDIFRPSCADFTYYHKYGFRDYRGGGRASARESVARVAAGAVAKMLLEHFGIFCESGIYSVGGICAENLDFEYARESEIFSLDREREEAQKALIREVRKSQDSIGGSALVRARGRIPIGLGEGLYHKLDSAIGAMMMGLNGVKAVEIGAGIESSTKRGSQNNDAMDENGFLSNHSGGMLGGLSNGENIEVKVHFKPTPSIFLTQRTQNTAGETLDFQLKGRHDPCIAIRGSVVCEAMLSLILADMLLANASSKLAHLERIYLS